MSLPFEPTFLATTPSSSAASSVVVVTDRANQSSSSSSSSWFPSPDSVLLRLVSTVVQNVQSNGTDQQQQPARPNRTDSHSSYLATLFHRPLSWSPLAATMNDNSSFYTDHHDNHLDYNVSSLVVWFHRVPRMIWNMSTTTGEDNNSPSWLQRNCNTTFDLDHGAYLSSSLTSALLVALVLLLSLGFGHFCVAIVVKIMVFRRRCHRMVERKKEDVCDEHTKRSRINGNHQGRLQANQQQQRPPRSRSSLETCLTLLLALGWCTLVVAHFMANWMLTEGLLQCESTFNEFVVQSNHSHHSFVSFNQTLASYATSSSSNASTSSSSSSFPLPSTTSLTSSLASLAHRNLNKLYETLNPSEQRSTIYQVQARVHSADVTLIAANWFAWTCTSLLWACSTLASTMRLLGKARMVRLHTILDVCTVLVVLMLATLVAINLCFAMVTSDFCLQAKPVLYHAMQMKLYANNPLTAPLVRYFLHCSHGDVGQAERDQLKQTLRLWQEGAKSLPFTLNDYLPSWTSASAVGEWNDSLDVAYQSLACTPTNRLINLGLEQTCTRPLDALAGIILVQVACALFALGSTLG